MADIIDDLAEIVLQFKRPCPKAIWFVDCFNDYRRFLNSVERLPDYKLEAGSPYEVKYETCFGLPIIPWESHIATPEEKTAAPSFCENQGIWVEMSDGNYFKIKLDFRDCAQWPKTKSSE